MQALLFAQFGGPDVLHLADAPTPTPAAGQVQVKVRANSLNVIDARVRNGQMGPLVNKKFPKILGCDFAGEVTAVGANVTDLRVGDLVFGATNPFNGDGFAEYLVAPAASVAKVPAGVDVAVAAAVPVASLAALYSLRELGKLAAGQSVLIHGCSGGTGLSAIQLAKSMGAYVTGVCGTKGVEISRRMGADEVLDYQAGPVQLTRAYDVIVNFSGEFPYAKAAAHLTSQGRMIEPSPTIPVFISSMLLNLVRPKKHLMLQTVSRGDDLAMLAELIAQGKLRIEIGGRFPIAQFREACTAQEKSGTIGKNVLIWP